MTINFAHDWTPTDYTAAGIVAEGDRGRYYVDNAAVDWRQLRPGDVLRFAGSTADGRQIVVPRAGVESWSIEESTGRVRLQLVDLDWCRPSPPE